jgi:hypothetical protein
MPTSPSVVRTAEAVDRAVPARYFILPIAMEPKQSADGPEANIAIHLRSRSETFYNRRRGRRLYIYCRVGVLADQSISPRTPTDLFPSDGTSPSARACASTQKTPAVSCRGFCEFFADRLDHVHAHAAADVGHAIVGGRLGRGDVGRRVGEADRQGGTTRRSYAIHRQELEHSRAS